MTSLARQRGLSLIELMIALLLSAMLLWGVLQIFDSNRNTMQMQTAFARTQESGRFAMDLLTKEIRMADYWGCVPEESAIKNHLDPADTDYNKAQDLYDDIGSDGVLGTDNSSSLTVGTMAVLDGTDTLTLRGADDACAGTGRMVPSLTAAALHVSQNCQVEEGEIILLTNCQSGELMTVTNLQQGNGGDSDKRTVVHNTGNNSTPGWVDNKTKDLQRQYGADARILKPYDRTYFIADGPAGPALYVADTGGDAVELVPGVEDMQILYGRDTDGDDVVDGWTQASANAADMEEAIAIKIQLVVASDSGVSAQDLTVTDLDGVDTTYADGKLRKVYLSTAKVRNRGRL
ncbi:type IV pilus assembly protein PilW [Microbulbifer donghaiensis]|uniref:Type IV pilus assembly protein PilW n=2 Tax=Microbulbifer donghaiensis TaxID=494016 RepID=A0A1M5HWI8_9GAMM|nr:type IV pilus assembly protein PilW [Microbulbifer donghaiensis]